MAGNIGRRPLQVVFEDGKPSAAILDLQEYMEILQLLEDIDDLQTLREMSSKPLEFESLEHFLEASAPDKSVMRYESHL